MTSSELRGLAFGSAFAAACSTPATLGIDFGPPDLEAGAGADASDMPEASGDSDASGTDDATNRLDGASDGPTRPDATSDAGGPVVLPTYCSSYPRSTPRGGWESKAVFYGSDRKLSYAIDAEGNRIPDFSYAGFEYGAVPPTIPQTIYVEGNKGMDDGSDATSRIQSALDQVGQRQLQNGYRGAVVLGPGIFNVSGTITLNRSGVVLRGSGHAGDFANNTILMARGNASGAHVVLGSGSDNGWTDDAQGTRTNITTSVVPVGARVFQVSDASRLSTGDNIVIVHPVTTAWLSAMNNGETGSDPAWTSDLGPIVYNRRIVGRRGNELTVDAPVFHHLNASLSQSYLYRTRRTNVVNHVGIENLWVDTEYMADNVENHAWSAIDVVGAEDAWIRDVVTIRFTYAGVRIQNGVRITVSGVEANDPMANREVGRMHNFALDARSQLVLFTDCHAQNGRHHFSSNAPMSSSGNVFLRSTSDSPNDDESSGASRPFSAGLLFDNVTESGSGSAKLGCTSEPGLSNAHGWSAVHSVLWNYRFDRSRGYVEKPPTGQNYAIGRGSFSGSIGQCPNATPGFIEQNSGSLRQESLYEAQTCDRLRP
jgi:hypothetical protein